MNKRSSKEDALKRLRQRGFRITQRREQLIHYILSQKHHWTIQELATKVQEKWSDVGIATIYRTVNLLSDEGFVTKTRVGLGPARFEVTPHDHHDHLTCVQCGKIVEFENAQIEKLQNKVAKELGFHLVDHRMELYGECRRPRCRSKKTDAVRQNPNR